MNMKTLYKKELNYYLNNPIGYIMLVLFAAFANFFFVKDLFTIGSASMQSFFNVTAWFMIIFVPAFTMRIISEEKRANTLEILLTLPVSETQIVMAKFLSLLTLLAIGLLLTVSLPISLSLISSLYLPEILIGYVGMLFLGGSFIAISMFMSSLTKNQVVAFLSSAIILFLILVVGSDFMASIFPKFIQDFLSYFSPLYHLDNFTKGLLDLRSIFYFISLTVIFVFLTITNLEKRE